MSWKEGRTLKTLKQGQKSFENCNVRVVEFHNIHLDPSTGGQYHDAGPDKKTDLWYKHLGYSAVLHCPRTDDDARTHIDSSTLANTKPEALDQVKDLAGALLCHNCIFSSMDPVAVTQHRIALAQAETLRLEAFTELAKARRLAISELQTTDVDFLLNQLDPPSL
jgi:hypothetical protein